MEITDVVRPAEDRQWRHTYVELRGTSLKFYDIKKEWGWDRAREWAISPSPDNPLWARKAGLIRAYNLQHAEVGIAADYKKYVWFSERISLPKHHADKRYRGPESD